MSTLNIDYQSKNVQSVISEMDKMSNAQKKMVLEAQGFSKSMDRSGRRSKDSLAGMRRGVLEVAGAFGVATTAGGAIQVVIAGARREWERFQQRIEQSRQTQVTAAEARAGALLQQPTDMTVGQVDAMIGRVAEASNVPQRDVWAAAGGMFSARGNLSQSQLEAAMLTAMRTKRAGGDTVNVGELGGSMLDIMKVAGLQTGDQALGWLRQFGVASRLEEVGKQGRALAPAVAAGVSRGFSPEQTAELLAYITQQTGDPTGERSRTATIALMNKLADNAKFSGDVFDRVAQAGQMVRGMSGSRQDKWFQELGGEQAARGAIRQLITGEASAAVAGVRASIGAPTAPGTAALASQYIEDVQAGGRAQSVRDVGMVGQAAVERIQLSDDRALNAAVAKVAREFVDAAGLWWPGRIGMKQTILAAENPVETLVEELNRRMGEKLYPEVTRVPRLPAQYGDEGVSVNAAFDPELRAAFDKMVEQLNTIAERLAPEQVTTAVANGNKQAKRTERPVPAGALDGGE